MTIREYNSFIPLFGYAPASAAVFIYLFTYLFAYLLTYLLTFTYLLTYLFTHLLTYLLIYLFTYLFTYLLTYHWEAQFLLTCGSTGVIILGTCLLRT